MEWTPNLQLFWVTLAIVNAGLADGKNRSRWNWFLISLLLGPLATFLIVTWPRREIPMSEHAPVSVSTEEKARP